jgi:tetratricopeptide (TPR) repeat protein
MSRERFPRFQPARRRYLGAGLLLLSLVVLGGWLLSDWITQPDYVPLARESTLPPAATGVGELFELAVERMQQRDYQAALQIWHRVLLESPENPQVKVNMGFTLIELGNYAAAGDFLRSAIEQNPYQANAYYGLALISEQAGDLETALGAMRSYIHLAGPDQDERFVRRARAALWEWGERLGEAREAARESGATPEPAE